MGKIQPKTCKGRGLTKDQLARLTRPCLWRSYAFWTYLMPRSLGGGRRWYDGRPYDLPPPVADEPWYTGTAETYSDGKKME